MRMTNSSSVREEKFYLQSKKKKNYFLLKYHQFNLNWIHGVVHMYFSSMSIFSVCVYTYMNFFFSLKPLFWLCVNIKGKFIDFKKWTKKKFKSKLNLNSNLAKEKEEKRGSNSNSFIHSFLTLCLSFWSVFFRFVSFFINLCLKRFNEKKIVHIRIEHCHHFLPRLLLHNMFQQQQRSGQDEFIFFLIQAKSFVLIMNIWWVRENLFQEENSYQ